MAKQCPVLLIFWVFSKKEIEANMLQFGILFWTVLGRINEFFEFFGSDGKNSFSTSVQVQKFIGKCVIFFSFFFSENLWKLKFFWVWVKIFDEMLVDFQQIFKVGGEIRAYSHSAWRKNSETRWCVREISVRKWWFFGGLFIKKNNWNLIRSVLGHMSTLEKNKNSVKRSSRSCRRRYRAKTPARRSCR